MRAATTFLGLLAACGDSSGAEGSGSDSGSGTTTTTTEVGSTTDTVPTGSGSEGMTTGDTCPVLPETVADDLTVGPGCVRMYRTDIVDGATLTIVAGTTVQVEAGGFLHAGPYGDNSALVVEGTETEPVIFQSAAASPAPGDWQCVRIGTGSADSKIVWTVFEHGGQACDAVGSRPETTVEVNAPALAFSFNTVRASASQGVILGDGGAVREFRDNSFADNARPSLRVAPAALLSVAGGQVFADADEVVEIDGTFDEIGAAGTWSAQSVPYRVLGYLQVGPDGDVELAAGTVVQLDGNSLEVFAGKLHVAGTADAPVVFTSAEDAPQAGDWGCLVYSSVTSPPQIDHAVFEYAGNGLGCTGAAYTAALVGPETMQVTGSTFRELAGAAIRSSTCDPGWCDNTFEGVDPLFECADPPVCP
ncbi:hypothetical protein [Nannocystis exedens]|nr:hypothetical protein [Nannocystis exedens]